jgi:hypothetical protein
MTPLDFSEQFLRCVWQRQEFSTAKLHTADGMPVRILSPGFPNLDGGPDYRDAKIRIGKVTYVGDVELHASASDWLSHGHQDDPHYNSVILHVVMTADTMTPPARTVSRRIIPLLVLHPFLDGNLHEALTRRLLDEDAKRTHHLPCYGLNDAVPSDVVLRWIQKLASDRVEIKIRRFEERLRQLSDERRAVIREPYPRYYGNPEDIPLPRKEYTRRDLSARALWEQLLYEGIMEAMGYTKNRVPFLTLAQAVRLDLLREHSLTDTQMMMALLFGAAGLLPSTRTIADKASRAYVRSLRRRWKEVKRHVKGSLLNEGDWLFFRLRPHNFPTARLATWCFLLPSLFGSNGFQRIIDAFRDDLLSPSMRVESLAALFVFTPDDFWRQHYHFRAPSRKSGIALGTARINEILINVLIPLALLYARVFNNTILRTNARRLLSWLPATPDNLITRTMQSELAGMRATITTANLQQGVVQLYKAYCLPVRCHECAIGERTYPSKPMGK